MTIRPARSEDAANVVRIYNIGIASRQTTFETRLRTPEEILPWFSDRYPFLVAEDDGRVIAFAVAGPYSPRECYAGIGDLSVYVDENHRGRGVGTEILFAAVEQAAQLGLWKLVGRVFPENQASLRMLEKTGFRQVGRHEKHGVLEGVWRDVIVVERLIAPLPVPEMRP